MSDLTGSGAAAGGEAPDDAAQEARRDAPGREEAPAQAEERRRRSRRGGLPDDLDLTGDFKPEDDEDEPQRGGDEPEDVRLPKKKSAHPAHPAHPADDQDEPGAEVEGDEPAQPAEGADDDEPGELEIPDDHTFMIELDPEKGPEPWTYEQLKQSAKLTEEAIKWKGWGEKAVEQRNILHRDLDQNPMQTLYNVRRALGHDAQSARAWVVKAATDLVNENFEYEELDPDKRTIMELQTQLRQAHDALRRQNEEDEELQRTSQEQESFQQAYNEVAKSIDSLGYEVTDDVVELVLQRLDELHLAGHTYATPTQVTKAIMKELEEAEKQRWQKLDPAKAPPELLERIRKFDVERLRSEQKPRTPQGSRTEPNQTRRRSRRVAGLSI